MNPIFYETLQIHYEAPGVNSDPGLSQYELETAPPIVLDLFDEDDDGIKDVFDQDDFLGRAQIDIKDVILNQETGKPDYN